MFTIRDARLADASRIREIYDPYVRTTAITFEYVTPSVEEFEGRMERTMQRYPYLVAEEDGQVVGYAYANPFGTRAAYGWTCEVSIYLDQQVHGHGLGRALYAALEDALLRMGVVNVYACVAYPPVPDEHLTTNSADFHEHLGFTVAGHLHQCGFKFGRWYDMLYMEKVLAEHRPDQPPVATYRLLGGC